MLGEEISTEGPIYIYGGKSLNLMAKFNWSSPFSNPFNSSRQINNMIQISSMLK